MEKYLAYVNRSGDVAEVPVIYDPVWPDVEKYVPNGVFWDKEIPKPEDRPGYVWTRMIKLEGRGAPLIYYTYATAPPSPETEFEKAKTRIADLETRIKMLEHQSQPIGEAHNIHE